MPSTTPSAAQRVTRALQHAHTRAEQEREQAAEHLRRLTEQHAHAVAVLYEAHAEEQALAAALAEAGGRPWRVEQAERERAERAQYEADRATVAASLLVDRAREQAGPEVTPARIVATARRLSAQASPEAAALARTLADPTSTAATRAAAAQAAHAAQDSPQARAHVANVELEAMR